jgi:hypothetical protein
LYARLLASRNRIRGRLDCTESEANVDVMSNNVVTALSAKAMQRSNKTTKRSEHQIAMITLFLGCGLDERLIFA